MALARKLAQAEALPVALKPVAAPGVLPADHPAS